ncbi:MAG: hypothetical protein H7X99_06840 [Saprospiraceae bacterium]|nr:hypothetical protein [Saprospiraceae bacterium]
MQNKTPTWAIITAIFMMLIGGCGIKTDLQSINIREILALKDKIITKIENDNNAEEDTIDTETTDTSLINTDTLQTINDTVSVTDTTLANNNGEDDDNEEVKEIFDEVFHLSDEMTERIILFGYIGLFFSLLYILGGLFLLIKRSFSINLAYAVVGVNIVFSIVRWTMLSGDEMNKMLSIANSVGSALSIIVSIIVLVIIVSNDKSAYEEVYQD